MMNIIEVLESCALPVVSDYEHRKRLSRVSGRNRYIMNVIDTKVISDCENAGLVWWVGNEFVKRFQYVASVRYKFSSHELPIYIGDIPDFALDRIEFAVECGFEYITIHSNEPLPTVTLATIDPVVIAWVRDPLIVVPGIIGRILGFKICCARETRGLVLAVWGSDQEKVL